MKQPAGSCCVDNWRDTTGCHVCMRWRPTNQSGVPQGVEGIRILRRLANVSLVDIYSISNIWVTF